MARQNAKLKDPNKCMVIGELVLVDQSAQCSRIFCKRRLDSIDWPARTAVNPGKRASSELFRLFRTTKSDRTREFV